MPRSKYSCRDRLSLIITTRLVKKCNDVLNNWYRGKQAHTVIIKEHSPKAWASTCRSSCEATIRAVQTPILSVRLAAPSPRIRSLSEVSETVAASGAFSSCRLLLSWIRSEAGLSWQAWRELCVCVWVDEKIAGASLREERRGPKTCFLRPSSRRPHTEKEWPVAPAGCCQFLGARVQTALHTKFLLIHSWISV